MTDYTHRYLARIVIEAETPLSIGSGEKDLVTDTLVATDSNGLPYIPATSIAGVVRSMMKSLGAYNNGVSDKDIVGSLFGFQGSGKNRNKGKGSEIIFTEAKILDSHGHVMDGLCDMDTIASDSLLCHYATLPVRQHVRITNKGTAADKGLFSGQVVFAGSRFCFEIEMVSDGQNFTLFESVLTRLRDVSFRLGGGTRDGFGKIRVVDMRTVELDLMNKEALNAYLAKSASLDSVFWKEHGHRTEGLSTAPEASESIIHYRLELRPESFFQFGSGYSDDEADMTPVKAKKVEWTETDSEVTGTLTDNLVLIPATSLKGALAHRVAFHWNRLSSRYADDMKADAFEKITGSQNEAVRLLFGSEGDGHDMTRGNVIFSDIIQKKAKDKIFNHLKIDRFTGGGIEGALFSEKAVYGEGECYTTEILVDKKSLLNICAKSADIEATSIIQTFEKAIDDLCQGMLPLGGGVNRGHGVFNGTLVIVNDNEHEEN